MSNVSKNIKNAIKLSGLSQREIEKQTGIPHSAIQRYASGASDRIPIERLSKIAKATGTTTSYLLGVVDNPRDNSFSTAVFELFLKNLNNPELEKMTRERVEAAINDHIDTLLEICTEEVNVGETVTDEINSKFFERYLPERIVRVTEYIFNNKNSILRIMPGFELSNNLPETDIELANEALIYTVHRICGINYSEASTADNVKKIELIQSFIKDNENTLKRMMGIFPEETKDAEE